VQSPRAHPEETAERNAISENWIRPVDERVDLPFVVC
jgi:hypothetical protein